MVWYRAAKAVQSIMTSIFGLRIFLYVDDAFWVEPAVILNSGLSAANWIGDLFKRVVTDLLGWDLDPDKADVGSCVVVLGVEITLDGEDSFWRLSPMKRQRWIDDLKTVLADDKLTPGHASKLCGRLAFLNSCVFNKTLRALLRPLVWRQSCVRRVVTLTPRLRFALKWFLAVLDQACSRRINL